MTAIKKWTDYNPLAGAVLRGDETFLMADAASTGTVTAATISFDAATKTISDAGSGMPVAKVGAIVLVSGSASNDGFYTVVSSDASNLVTSQALVDEAAGASVTVSEVAAMYRITLAEYASYIAALSVPDPLIGHTFKDSRHTAVTADVTGTTTRNASDGNVHELTLTGNCTIDVDLADADASYLHLIIIPGAYTAALGTSFHKWLGDAPSSIAAENHIVITSRDGGTTNVARDLGGAV